MEAVNIISGSYQRSLQRCRLHADSETVSEDKGMQRGFWLILGHVLPHGVFVPPNVSELRVGEEVEST